jgi:peptidyl-prolyl cis-trans isomerase C
MGAEMRINLVAVSACLLFGLASVSAAAQGLVSGAGVAVTVQDLESDLTNVPPEARANAFGRPEMVHNNVSNLYVRRVLAAEAVASGLAQEPAVQVALALARDRVLSDARLAQIDKANLPTPQALEAYALTSYKAEPKRFEAPERVTLRHILVRATEPDARAKAEQLLKELQAGANFAELAKARSQDPVSASKGGSLGTVVRGRMVKAFEDAAFKLNQPGELSEVVETNFGFHVIKLDEKLPAGLRPFEEVKDQLLKEGRAKVINDGRQAEQDRILSAATFDQLAIEAFAKGQAANK